MIGSGKDAVPREHATWTRRETMDDEIMSLYRHGIAGGVEAVPVLGRRLAQQTISEFRGGGLGRIAKLSCFPDEISATIIPSDTPAIGGSPPFAKQD